MKTAYDVVIIGSGAAGSVMAFQIVRNNPGVTVAILERGIRQDPQTFSHNTLDMLARVYKQGGLQTTKDNDVVFTQGETVGGSTVVNNAIWFRADLNVVLKEWAKEQAFLDKAELTDAYEELEAALHIEKIPPDMANAGSEPFLRGCRALNISAEYLSHNRDRCLGCGWCNYGCKYNRKTSMLVTYLPWAEKRGVDVIDGCKDVSILHDSRRAIGVTFRRKPTADGSMERHELKAGKMIVCAGAIGSTEVLLRSNINPHGRVGRNFHALGGVLVSGEFDESLHGFDKIGLTCVAHASPDFLIESFFSPPAIFALGLSGWFEDHFQKMSRYDHYAQAGVMVPTDPTGSITLNKHGAVEIDLTFGERDVTRLKEGMCAIAKIFFAAGAKRVIPATYKTMEFASVGELKKLDKGVTRADDLLIGSAHPQGGNKMSDDKNQGVVDSQFKVHGFDNVYVADASVFPTNIRANCQATVMALSHCAAKKVMT